MIVVAQAALLGGWQTQMPPSALLLLLLALLTTSSADATQTLLLLGEGGLPPGAESAMRAHADVDVLAILPAYVSRTLCLRGELSRVHWELKLSTYAEGRQPLATLDDNTDDLTLLFECAFSEATLFVVRDDVWRRAAKTASKRSLLFDAGKETSGFDGDEDDADDDDDGGGGDDDDETNGDAVASVSGENDENNDDDAASVAYEYSPESPLLAAVYANDGDDATIVAADTALDVQLFALTHGMRVALMAPRSAVEHGSAHRNADDDGGGRDADDDGDDDPIIKYVFPGRGAAGSLTPLSLLAALDKHRIKRVIDPRARGRGELYGCMKQ
jgi:hypothetical protein